MKWEQTADLATNYSDFVDKVFETQIRMKHKALDESNTSFSFQNSSQNSYSLDD